MPQTPCRIFPCNWLCYAFTSGLLLFFAGSASAAIDVTPLADFPLWSLFLLALWTAVLNPCIGRAQRGKATFLAACIGGGLAYALHGDPAWSAATALASAVLGRLGGLNGLLWLILATLFGYRCKRDVEDPVESSSIQGELGGGGYRHTGAGLRGGRASGSWS